MILYGRNPVREALRGHRDVSRIWTTNAAAREPWIAESQVETHRAESEELTALSGSEEHQGVCAEVSDYQYVSAKQLLDAPDALVLVLDEIQDPHNLGALARVAECAGAAGMVIAERRSAEVTPAVCKASAGAVEHLAIARVGNISDYLATAKAAEAWVYGASADGDAAYDQPDFNGKVVLVVGSEGKGLRPRVAKSCDALISIPMHGRVGSLNVSTATAVLMWSILQSRVQK
ncbi:MAG TPA: 23S rRNA (guanosine(2251)-2'-O)-methyltransferase RlmB [Solirubrobacterales bacterium]|jgi:23S rRNA (guanosine2251-2'-O)-methyltransferase|nr:23S rRNA (guanosine(2251)-2'-O)-methyltransferase RlmB [Solirubrobacterales bacterium]